MNSIPANSTIFVIDDDPSFLRSCTRLLTAAGYTVQSFGSAGEFLSQLTPEMCGCVVTDLQMPGCNGLQLQQTLAKSINPMPVIFLSAQGDIPTTVHAMRGGAEDFLTKLGGKEELLHAIKRALARDARERKQRERVQELRIRFNALTEREVEVLSHVVRGQLNKQIADDLGINERTVKLHRTNLTRTLQMQSVADLTRLVEELGLFKNEPPAE
jgi:FixJ family two-component response regulator